MTTPAYDVNVDVSKVTNVYVDVTPGGCGGGGIAAEHEVVIQNDAPTDVLNELWVDVDEPGIYPLSGQEVIVSPDEPVVSWVDCAWADTSVVEPVGSSPFDGEVVVSSVEPPAFEIWGDVSVILPFSSPTSFVIDDSVAARIFEELGRIRMEIALLKGEG